MKRGERERGERGNGERKTQEKLMNRNEGEK